MEIVEPVIHQELLRSLEEVQDGVKDVETILLLFKNINCIYADVVFEKFLWGLIKLGRWKNASN